MSFVILVEGFVHDLLVVVLRVEAPPLAAKGEDKEDCRDQ